MKTKKLIIGVVLGAFAIGFGTVHTTANEVVPISLDKTDISVMDEFGSERPLSPGINVISYSSPLIITGSTGKSIAFSAEVFDNKDGSVPSSVQILSLPSAESGVLLCNADPVSKGDKVSVLSIGSLAYMPECADDAEFLISTDATTVTRCIMKQRDGENNPPNAYSNEAVTTFTKLDTAVAGYLNGVDPDGDPISFEVVDYPSKGLLSIKDQSTGEFVYKPYEDVSGSDSFTYRIVDSFGKYSDTYTAKISIDDTVAQVFDDMADSLYQAAADDMVKSGIMDINSTDSGKYFEPNVSVSRIDFLIMAMKTMGAGASPSAAETPFADDGNLSDEEKGYLSAAYRLGIVKGSDTDKGLCFSPEKDITGAEAAVIINSILGLPADDSVIVSAMGDNVPAWAIGSISALTGEGFINSHTAPTNGPVTRENAAVILSSIKRRLS